AARAPRAPAHREWYVWADPRSDGSPPNNWLSVFGGPAWELDPATGQCYLHNFLPEQPDLNWWNRGVHDAFDDIMRFWFERGIAGFRIDVANGLVKDAEMRDNPLPTERDPPRGPAGVSAVATARRRVRPRAGGRDVAVRPRAPRDVLRERPGRAAPVLQLLVPVWGPRCERAPGDRGGDRGGVPRWRAARVDRVEPRRR